MPAGGRVPICDRPGRERRVLYRRLPEVKISGTPQVRQYLAFTLTVENPQSALVQDASVAEPLRDLEGVLRACFSCRLVSFDLKSSIRRLLDRFQGHHLRHGWRCPLATLSTNRYRYNFNLVWCCALGPLALKKEERGPASAVESQNASDVVEGYPLGAWGPSNGGVESQ
jgi:hypothetical protein